MRILIALPVLNEERVLERTVSTLRAFTAERLSAHQTTIVIADNGSDDATGEIGRALAARWGDVRYLRTEARGKGLAIRRAWESGDADAYAFMDADLATDISALPTLFARLEDGADIAVGSRAHPESRVERSMLRRMVSMGYRTFLRAVTGVTVADAPCGFKAISARTMREIVPKVQDTRWFFDTELLVLAERAGKRIDEVPVRWCDATAPGRTSKVRIVGLSAEYATQVFALRKRIGAPRSDGVRGVRDVVRTVSPMEWRVVAAAAAFAIIVTFLVPAYGLIEARRSGLSWSGRGIFAPGDVALYLNQIAQAREGAFLLENHATLDPMPRMAHPFWWVVGVTARLTGMTALGAYHAFRIALIPLLATVAYLFAAAFVSRVTARIAALFLFLFGGGVGMYVTPFLSGRSDPFTVHVPVDAWMAEALPFSSMLHSPHFLAAWTLILSTLGLFFLACRTARVSLAIASGISFLALCSFHPFHAPTILGVAGAYVIWDGFARGFRSGPIVAALVMGAIASPAICYYLWMMYATSHGEVYIAQNPLLTPPWPYVLLGFAGPIVLAVLSSAWGRAAFLAAGMGDPERRFLLAWTVMHFFAIYLPIGVQRRLLHGWMFPLSMLAAPALIEVWRRFADREPYRELRTMVVAAVLAVTLLSTAAWSMSRSFEYLAAHDPAAFFTSDQAAAHAWIRSSTSNDARFLASFEAGNGIFGWGGRAVHAGHWGLTPDLGLKIAEATRWYAAMSTEERTAFLHTDGITHVWYGPDERKVAPEFVPPDALETVFTSGDVTIYRVRSR